MDRNLTQWSILVAIIHTKFPSHEILGEISLGSTDFTIYTLVLKVSLMQSHLPWGEFSIFSAANAIHKFNAILQFKFHQVPITAGWTEAA